MQTLSQRPLTLRLTCSLVCSVLLLCSAVSEETEQPTLNIPTNLASLPQGDHPDHIFLCIGQSNMAGRDKVLEEDLKPIENRYLLNDQGLWETFVQPLNRHSNHRKELHMQGVSPIAGFATHYQQQVGDKTLGFIVNARGGTKIEEWAKDETLYMNTLERFSMTDIPRERFAGILWIQGFNNANDKEYLHKLQALINDLREEIQRPDLPVVIAQVPIYDDKYPINAQILEAPSAIENLAAVTNEGTAKFDQFHYNRASSLLIGKRMAEAFMGLDLSKLP